ncbi:MAG: SDR family oxidoreductase [Cytophagaceae bacterium]|nr:SDR family oxidoreductase [Cytophagaceae bacterium]
MNYLIFGASGATGQILTAQALNDHRVTAFVRDPASLQPKPNLTLAQGDVTDYESVRAALNGQTFDVVFSALGSRHRGKDRLNTVGTGHIVRAMRATGHTRLIVLSSLGVADAFNSWFTRKILVGFLLKEPHEDTRGMEKAVRESGLDYTLVRPPRLLNSPFTGAYRVATSPPAKRLNQIARADVAHFMLRVAEKGEFNRTAVAIGY